MYLYDNESFASPRYVRTLIHGDDATSSSGVTRRFSNRSLVRDMYLYDMNADLLPSIFTYTDKLGNLAITKWRLICCFCSSYCILLQVQKWKL